MPDKIQELKPDFQIAANGPVSDAFIRAGAGSFLAACGFVRRLPYRRNREKGNLLAIFNEQCGTCSSKHAALKQLTIENNVEGIELFIGIYRMNGLNTAKVEPVLKQYGLTHIPEAHCYLKYRDEVIDCSTQYSEGSNFKKDLLEEIMIEPVQAGDFKTTYHKNYLQNWLVQNTALSFEPGKLWQIREACILALSK